MPNATTRSSTLSRVYSITQEWYRRCRYQLIEVPRVSVEDRRTYVLQVLADSEVL